MSEANLNTSDVIDASELVVQDAKSGRAVWDDRGNSIWEWQTEPGVFTRDISIEQLKRLEASHLRLVDSSSQRHADALHTFTGRRSMQSGWQAARPRRTA
jgi:hypothetical protein